MLLSLSVCYASCLVSIYIMNSADGTVGEAKSSASSSLRIFCGFVPSCCTHLPIGPPDLVNGIELGRFSGSDCDRTVDNIFSNQVSRDLLHGSRMLTCEILAEFVAVCFRRYLITGHCFEQL
jgi:hypothetical protein